MLSTESQTQIWGWTCDLLQNNIYGRWSSWLYTWDWIWNQNWPQWKDWARFFNLFLWMIWEWFNTRPSYFIWHCKYNCLTSQLLWLNFIFVLTIVVNASTLMSTYASSSATSLQNENRLGIRCYLKLCHGDGHKDK